MNPKASDNLISLLKEIQAGGGSDKKLVDELQALREFALFDGQHQSIGGASVITSLSNLVNWMLRRAAEVGCETAISHLYRYVNTDRIPFRRIMVLAGAKVETPVGLAGGIEFEPFDLLSNSTWKKAVFDYFGGSWANYRPSAVLRQPFLQFREDLHQPPRTAIGDDDQFQDLEDVRLCMTAMGSCAPLWLGSWIEAEEWVPNLANMAHLPERLNAGNYPRTVGEDWTGLAILHSHWRALGVKEKRRLRVALSRLNTAIRRTELVDSAIDLGIAIDAVFLSGKPADRGEIGLTLRLRAAHFLGTDLSTRVEISDLFSALYLLRNIAVHAGTFGQRVKSPSSKTSREYDVPVLLNHGFCWVTKAIRQIIEHGDPDWHSIILK